MKLCAQVTIDGHIICGLSDSEIEEYVASRLTDIITEEVFKHMTISSTNNLCQNSVTYTGTITGTTLSSAIIGTITAPGGVIIGNGAYNITSSSSGQSSYSQLNMRVIEYTKNGKVTRVELQKYDESDNDWVKIPRIQIEE